MQYGKRIELFLVNGTADSLITADLSNWNGKAIKIPRKEVTDCGLEDITHPGVYFLFCKADNDDEKDSVYIGEAEDVKHRLKMHLRDYQSEKEPFYWNTAVIFTGRDLDKALIRYLENRFVEIARSCNRYDVLTKSTYRKTVIRPALEAEMEEFIDNVQILINVLGYKVLEPLVQQKTNVSGTVDAEILYITVGGVRATGIITSEGFVVLKGSTVNEKTNSNSLNPGMVKLREKIMSSDKVKELVTTEDILFSSSSAASDFILGYNASGPRTWKTKEGRPLKDIEEGDPN